MKTEKCSMPAARQLGRMYAAARQARCALLKSPGTRSGARQADRAKTPPVNTQKGSVPEAQRPGRHVCSGAAGALRALAQLQVRGAQTAERRRC